MPGVGTCRLHGFAWLVIRATDKRGVFAGEGMARLWSRGDVVHHPLPHLQAAAGVD